jgi:acyl-coenzyme A thioesterase PaaI-like protein
MNEPRSTGEKPSAVAAQAVRRLTSVMLDARRRGIADPEMAEKITELADRLEAVAFEARERVTGRIGSADGALERSPVIGSGNPLAVPLRFERNKDGTSHARAAFPTYYEGGSTGFVHGGVAGLVLDAAMASANSAAQRPGVTAEMTFRYLRPIPVCRDLDIRGLHVRHEGRKSWTRGSIEVDGEPTVVCEGLFVTKAIRS